MVHAWSFAALLLLSLASIAVCAPPASADVSMDTYRQEVIVRFRSADAAADAHVRIAPLYHNLTAAFSSRWDDNNSENIHVQQIMATYGQKGTFYLNNPDGTGSIDRKLLEGGNSIGVHTLSHPYLTAVSRNQAFQEILGDRIALEVATQTPAIGFAFPFLDYRGEFDGAKNQPELEELLSRSGLYFAAENAHDFVTSTGLITAEFVSIDGAPWYGTTREAVASQHRSDADRPLFLNTMHAWPNSWGGSDFPKLAAEYETWSHVLGWWYCNQNDYAAYRCQFLHTTVDVSQHGSALTLTLSRPSPLDLNDLVPITCIVEGASSDDIVSVTCPTAAVDFPNPADRTQFDLHHDTGADLPSRYVRTDNRENSMEPSRAASVPGLPGITALLYQSDGALVLNLVNRSPAPLTRIRAVFRLPLRWQNGGSVRIAALVSGATKTIRIPLLSRSDDLFYVGGSEINAAQIDFRLSTGERIRLYATCQDNAPGTDPSYPRDGFLVLGPLPRDRADFPFATFAGQVMIDPSPKSRYTLFDDVSVSWEAPDPADTGMLNPNIIWTIGRPADATFYTWDPKIYYKYGKDLYFVVRGSVVSPSDRTVQAIFATSSVEEITVNGIKVEGSRIPLHAGANDLRILYQPVPSPGFSPRNYGIYFRLVDDDGQRITDLSYLRPEP